jgi:hypothetical protein
VPIKLHGTPSAFSLGEDAAKDVAIEIPRTGHVLVEFQCGGNFDCKKVTLQPSAQGALGKRPATKEAAQFFLPGGPNPTTFTATVQHGSVTAANKLAFAGGAAGAAGGPTTPPAPKTPTFADSIGILLATPCELDAAELTRPEDRFLVTPFGRVISSQKSYSTTEDTAWVSVVVHPRLVDLITPRAGSDLAQPLVANIYGQELEFFKLTSRTDTAVAKRVPRCAVTPRAPIGPLASPKGVVNITVFDGKPDTKVGSFEFVVRPTYTGTFAFGGVSTRVANPTFEKVYNGTDTVVARRDSGPRGLFVATYTHFLTGRRDLTHPPTGPLGYLNPTIGVVINDIENNLLYGVALELRPGLSLSFGHHLARVRVIDPEANVEVGDEFENRGAAVPTTSRWTSKAYYGALIDVRAAGGLIRSLWASTK